MAKKILHPDVIPWRKAPKDKLDRFIELYSNQDALKRRLYYAFPARTESLDCLNVAEWLWRVENPDDWRMAKPLLSTVHGVEPCPHHVELAYYQRQLEGTLLKWVLERRLGELSWLSDYINKFSKSRFPRVEVRDTSPHPSPTTLHEVVLAEFFKLSGLSIFPNSPESTRRFSLPTKKHLRDMVRDRLTKLGHDADDFDREFVRSINVLGLGGLPQYKTKEADGENQFTW
jgi:hypothetical protein